MLLSGPMENGKQCERQIPQSYMETKLRWSADSGNLMLLKTYMLVIIKSGQSINESSSETLHCF